MLSVKALLWLLTSFPVHVCLPIDGLRGELGSARLNDFATIVSTENGLFMISPFDNVVGQYLELAGEWEQTHLSIIKELIPTGSDVLYLDVGANIGAWTVPLAKHAAGGTVVAFEATREVALFLGANIVLNGVQNAFVEHVVVGEEEGVHPTIELTLQTQQMEQRETSFATFSVGSLKEELKKGNNIKTLSTPGIVLDNYYDEKLKRCPDFIKMDIENHEFYALKGARRMLAACRPVLLLEIGCYHLNKSIILLLDSLGYSMSWLFAPFVRPDFEFNGMTVNDIILNKLFVVTGIDPLTGDGGVNMIAVPKSRKGDLLRYSRADFMVPIDVAGGRFYIQDYDVSICLVDTGCIKLRHVAESDGMCAGSVIPEEDIYFWRNLL